MARPKWPDRIGQTETALTETAQTETAQTETARPNQPDQIGKTESTVPGLNTPLVCAPSQHTPLLHNS